MEREGGGGKILFIFIFNISVNSQKQQAMTSPFKTIEFDIENTPSKKKLVENQINGWMQTCVKKTQSLRMKKMPCRFIISRSLNRQYKNSLVMHALEKYSEKTAASENQSRRYTSSPYKSQNRNDKVPNDKNIEISQFTEKQTHEIIIFNENTKIALLRLPELSKKRSIKNAMTHHQEISNNIIESKQGKKSYLPSRYIFRRKLASIGKI